MAIHKASSALPPPAKNNIAHIFPWRRRQHWRALGSEPYNPIMCPPHRKHSPPPLRVSVIYHENVPKYFHFLPTTLHHAARMPLSISLTWFTLWGDARARAHTHTHTHTVPDVCRKLNQTLRLNHLPPMSLTFILLYQIYPSIRSTLPHRLTSRSTWRINTGALSSSSSRSIINSLKTKT